MQILKVALMVVGGLIGAIIGLVLVIWLAWWTMETESLRRECDGRLPDRGYWERFYCGDTYTAMRAIIDPAEKAQHA